jgi:hypothetical protein
VAAEPFQKQVHVLGGVTFKNGFEAVEPFEHGQVPAEVSVIVPYFQRIPRLLRRWDKLKIVQVEGSVEESTTPVRVAGLDARGRSMFHGRQ